MLSQRADAHAADAHEDDDAHDDDPRTAHNRPWEHHDGSHRNGGATVSEADSNPDTDEERSRSATMMSGLRSLGTAVVLVHLLRQAWRSDHDLPLTLFLTGFIAIMAGCCAMLIFHAPGWLFPAGLVAAACGAIGLVAAIGARPDWLHISLPILMILLGGAVAFGGAVAHKADRQKNPERHDAVV